VTGGFGSPIGAPAPSARRARARRRRRRSLWTREPGAPRTCEQSLPSPLQAALSSTAVPTRRPIEPADGLAGEVEVLDRMRGPAPRSVRFQSANPRDLAVKCGDRRGWLAARKAPISRDVWASSEASGSSCHAEGRGFESLQPLSGKPPHLRGFPRSWAGPPDARLGHFPRLLSLHCLNRGFLASPGGPHVRAILLPKGRLAQRRGVVDSVARDGNRLRVGLKGADELQLVLWGGSRFSEAARDRWSTGNRRPCLSSTGSEAGVGCWASRDAGSGLMSVVSRAAYQQVAEPIRKRKQRQTGGSRLRVSRSQAGAAKGPGGSG
jgi:hypothetical protein